MCRFRDNGPMICASSSAFISISLRPECIFWIVGRIVGLSYLLAGIASPGDDGHTARFHDCSHKQLSASIAKRNINPQKSIFKYSPMETTKTYTSFSGVRRTTDGCGSVVEDCRELRRRSRPSGRSVGRVVVSRCRLACLPFFSLGGGLLCAYV